MIKQTFYKDRPAISITNHELVATFLYLDGAKLVSLKDKNGNEFLAQSVGEKYRCLGLDTNYIDSECSAFDDMFPTIDPCEINGIKYLDHGEVARREHTFCIYDDKVAFSCNLENLNILFQKYVFFEDECLTIKYKIKNFNTYDFPYIFAGHMMFKGELGATVQSEFENSSEKEIMFGNPTGQPNVLCEKGTDKEWKYYYKQSKNPLLCYIKYPLSKYIVSVKSESDIIKYLGVWMNPGDLNGMYNVTLEPCSGLYDNPIKAKDTCTYIKAGEEIEFILQITIKK